jgi:hypothetical protein
MATPYSGLPGDTLTGAKALVVKPITSQAANALVRRYHYSGKVVNNSCLHFGVWYDGFLEGAMSFGPSLDKSKLIGLVRGTEWHGFLELNRMAFSDRLPRNSESRALAVAFRLIRQHYPQIKWVISFADATQSGDGTIYRAVGFLLTAIKVNSDLLLLPNGIVSHSIAQKTGRNRLVLFARTKGYSRAEGKVLPGLQLRYVKFLDSTWRNRLTVSVLPYSEIAKRGAGMYCGKRRAGSVAISTAGDQPARGGVTPTPALQTAVTLDRLERMNLQPELVP